MLSFRTLLLLLLCCCSSATALAGSRTTVSFANVDSVGTVGNPSNIIRTVTLTGGYPLKRMDFSGTLQTLIAGTALSEAHVKVTPPAGMGPVFTLLITFDNTLQPVGTIFSGSNSLGAPPAGWSSSGTWTFEFFESFDDGPGADVRWKTFNITFNDAPASPNLLSSSEDLGIISTGQRSVTASFIPNRVKWYRFHTADSIGAVGQGNALAINTSTGFFSPITDTVIALYNSDGQRIAFNDDISGSNLLSVLSFGTSVPLGATVPDVLVGASGSLDPGTYYLAVCPFAAANTYTDDFGVTNASTTTGSITVTLRATVPGAGGSCPADFNRSGSVEVQDIFDYLSAWFAGCQ